MLTPEVGYWINKEALSYIYGWTPQEIDEMPLMDLMAYQAILKGRNEKMKKDMKKGEGGSESWRDRKELR